MGKTSSWLFVVVLLSALYHFSRLRGKKVELEVCQRAVATAMYRELFSARQRQGRKQHQPAQSAKSRPGQAGHIGDQPDQRAGGDHQHAVSHVVNADQRGPAVAGDGIIEPLHRV